jgi:DMATS type aromatic prenyltransferase
MTASENISTAFDSIDLAFDDNPISLEERPDITRQSQVGFDAEKLVPTQTYVECGIEKLTALCHSVGLNSKIEQITDIFRTLTLSWGETAVGAKTTWKSDVSDDCSPFEFSIALDPNKAELRVLIEAQGRDPNLQSNWQAGLELNQQLAAKYNVDLDRFEQIADLFAPTNSEAKFSMWHSACFYPDKEPAFKIYLNPQAQSKSKAAAIVEESLVRLGFDRAWLTLAETAAQRGPDKDEFIYFSLDLAAHVQARVKVYLRHHDATPAELESALSAANNYVAGDAIEFCQAMAPGQTSFTQKPVITSFAFIKGDNSVPYSGTLHLPISNYAADDRVVCDKIDLYFIQHGFPVSVYQSVLKSFAKRQLEAGIGMHSYVSLRRQDREQRVTIYLNPEINAVRSSAEISTAKLGRYLSSLEETVWHHKTNSVENHPFFQRLHKEPVNLTNLWLLFANVQEGIVDHFTRRLALVVAHIDDEYIRCILAKQLNEELGNGNIEQVHRKIFDRLTLALEPYKPEIITSETLVPGYQLSKKLEELYSNSNAYIGVGAAIMMEIRGEQRDEIINKELVRTKLDSSILSWFYMHGELELDHADEVIKLASQIDNSDRDKDAVLQGLEMTSDVLWDFCNEMYRVCFM